MPAWSTRRTNASAVSRVVRGTSSACVSATIRFVVDNRRTFVNALAEALWEEAVGRVAPRGQRVPRARIDADLTGHGAVVAGHAGGRTRPPRCRPLSAR